MSDVWVNDSFWCWWLMTDDRGKMNYNSWQPLQLNRFGTWSVILVTTCCYLKYWSNFCFKYPQAHSNSWSGSCSSCCYLLLLVFSYSCCSYGLLLFRKECTIGNIIRSSYRAKELKFKFMLNIWKEKKYRVERECEMNLELDQALGGGWLGLRNKI